MQSLLFSINLLKISPSNVLIFYLLSKLQPFKVYSVYINSIPVFIGAGGATAMYGNTWDESYWQSYDYYYNSDAYFVFEPAVEVEVNIMKFFRISLGARYRLTNGLNLYYDYYEGDTYISERVDPKALDGFTFDMSLKFGWF